MKERGTHEDEDYEDGEVTSTVREAPAVRRRKLVAVGVLAVCEERHHRQQSSSERQWEGEDAHSQAAVASGLVKYPVDAWTKAPAHSAQVRPLGGSNTRSSRGVHCEQENGGERQLGRLEGAARAALGPREEGGDAPR